MLFTHWKGMREEYIEAIENEGEITESVKRIVQENGGYLGGLEHRIKSPATLYERVILDLIELRFQR